LQRDLNRNFSLRNVDLHTHSKVSDGLLAPAVLVCKAAELGVDTLALTDHDDLRGLPEARAAAEQAGIAFVNGVEISVSWETTTLHIVGLHIDTGNAALNAGLQNIRDGRGERAKGMAQTLSEEGIEGCLLGAYSYADNKEMVGRTHFARYLVEKGVVPDIKTAFKHYLVKGKPGYVAHTWASLEDALAWIHAAGGVAVIAHPGRYKLGAGALRRLFGEFKERGGDALEVVTGNHTADQARYFAGMSKAFGLAASRGSDYHGPGESFALPGRLPPLPAGLTPVWELWEE
jgi:predicted metal-dependent phosphoesterase TrpH